MTPTAGSDVAANRRDPTPTWNQTPTIKPPTSHFTDAYSRVYLTQLCQLHCSHYQIINHMGILDDFRRMYMKLVMAHN